MAAVTVVFAGDANVTCSYTYDDVSLLITALSADNSDSLAHVVVLEVLDPVTFAQKFAATRTIAPNGTTSFNVSAFNAHMVDRLSKTGAHYLGFPFILGCAIS